ncbi:MAG: hypothetical protein B7Z74_09380, partial [Deltaproteobacteria bacterium 21-66-5]
MQTIRSGTIIDSPVTGFRYRAAELLGQGGFGSAYRIDQLSAKGGAVAELCLKVTFESEGWHREAYFGEMLKRCDRAIHMYESFPLFPRKRQQKVRYCLIFELAERGTILDYLERTGRPWSAKRAIKEVVALLRLLDMLHGTGAVHRDITPMNVFVCRNRCLKLGDFGIAKHALGG